MGAAQGAHGEKKGDELGDSAQSRDGSIHTVSGAAAAIRECVVPPVT